MLIAFCFVSCVDETIEDIDFKESSIIYLKPNKNQNFVVHNNTSSTLNIDKLKTGDEVKIFTDSGLNNKGLKQNFVLRRTNSGSEMEIDGSFFENKSIVIVDENDVEIETIDSKYLQNNSSKNQCCGLLSLVLAVCCTEVEYKSDGKWYVKWKCDCLSVNVEIK